MLISYKFGKKLYNSYYVFSTVKPEHNNHSGNLKIEVVVLNGGETVGAA